jgi:hypothetical protein
MLIWLVSCRSRQAFGFLLRRTFSEARIGLKP